MGFLPEEGSCDLMLKAHSGSWVDYELQGVRGTRKKAIKIVQMREAGTWASGMKGQ